MRNGTVCARVLERSYFDFECERSASGDCNTNDCYETEPTGNAADNGREAADGTGVRTPVFVMLHS